MKKVYQMENLDCANCAAKIEAAVRGLEGVDNATVNFMAQKLVIETSGDLEVILPQIAKIISKIEPDCEIRY